MSFDQLKSSITDCVLRPFEHEKAYIKCPHCGEVAEVNTSMVLTSYPAQYKYHCKHCDKHGFIFCHNLENLRIKTATIKLENIENALCTPCLVCGTPITTRTMHYEAVICEDCKKAILKLRKMLEDKNND